MPIRPIMRISARARELLQNFFAKRKRRIEKTLPPTGNRKFGPKHDRPKERGKGGKIDLDA